MNTPRELSPHMLVQEFLRDEPWRLLVAVVMLNVTTGKQIHRVINEFFDRWPEPRDFLRADDEEVREFIRPLGLVNRRSATLKKMTKAYVDERWEEPEDLPGIGKYGADSYHMFVVGRLVEDVRDKELKKYVRWAKTRRSNGNGEQERHDLPGGAAAGHDLHGGIRAGLPEGPLASRRSDEEGEEQARQAPGGRDAR